jgi:hypothetical protein
VNNIRQTIVKIAQYEQIQQTEYKYNIVKTVYHNIATKVLTGRTDGQQKFITRMRSNQLCTNSKIDYWSNNLKDSTCKRCKSKRENQLHLLVECPKNQKYHEQAARKFLACLQKGLKTNATIPDNTPIWGLPYTISMYDVIPNPTNNNQNIYKRLLGLLTWDTYNKWNNLEILKKPSATLTKINNILIETSMEIWKTRCILQLSHNINA